MANITLKIRTSPTIITTPSTNLTRIIDVFLCFFLIKVDYTNIKCRFALCSSLHKCAVVISKKKNLAFKERNKKNMCWYQSFLTGLNCEEQVLSGALFYYAFLIAIKDKNRPKYDSCLNVSCKAMFYAWIYAARIFFKVCACLQRKIANPFYSSLYLHRKYFLSFFFIDNQRTSLRVVEKWMIH
jgi:hypothetical protein